MRGWAWRVGLVNRLRGVMRPAWVCVLTTDGGELLSFALQAATERAGTTRNLGAC